MTIASRRSVRAARTAFLLLVSSGFAGLSCGSPDPATTITPGRYLGDGITVTLTQEGQDWSGKIQLGVRVFDAKGKLEGVKLSGSFAEGATNFPFEMSPKDKGFELSSGGSVYALQREVPKNPLAKSNPLAKKTPPQAKNPLAQGGGKDKKKSVEPNPLDPDNRGKTPAPAEGTTTHAAAPDKKLATTEAGRVALEGKLYKHPLGFRFRYPKTWNLTKAGEGVLTLTPKDVLQSPQGPLEAILVMGDSSEGIQQAKDPRVASQLDEQMRKTFPFLERKGKAKTVRLGGKEFSENEWQGTNRLGKVIQGKVWACILQDSALMVLALMPPEQFQKRETVLKAIAGSFRFKEPPRDPQLVGAWRNETSFSSGTFGSVTSRVMDLRADGTSTWGSRFMASMTHTDSGGHETGSTSGDSGQGDLLMGRWSAANKRLYITWKNGTEEEFGYYREGDSMLLTPGDGGKKQLWKKIR